MKIYAKNYCEHLDYKKDDLFLENIKCTKLAKNYGTPTYCYSVNEIRNRFLLFKDKLKELNPLILFAMKSNYNPNIISILSNLGCGVDVVSKGEIEIALSAGVCPKKIVFSGVGKTDEEITFALKKNILQLNVESIEELVEIEKLSKKYKKKIEISLRVNPDIDANTHKKISTGNYGDKFGIPHENIIDIFKTFKNNDNVKINGLAIHIGSQIIEINPFKKAFKKLRKIVKSLKKNKFNIKKIDLGGGIGINYSNNKVICLDEYKNQIKKNFSDLNVEIILEPGRFLVGPAGILLTKVIRVKNVDNQKFLILDSGMNDLIRPSMYNAYHEILPVKLTKKKITKYDVVGPICESGDIFAKNRGLFEIKKGDLLAICSVGAYGTCMTSYYNCRTPPKEILIDGSKSINTKITKSVGDFYNNEIQRNAK